VIEEGIDVAVGDSVIVIKEDGSIGQVIMPEVKQSCTREQRLQINFGCIRIYQQGKG
jgi:hypothetical protein